jgi:Flp pilus assembly protein TadG
MSGHAVSRLKAAREGERTMFGHRRTGAPRERGQILVIFALGLVVMIGMVGLVLDGGSAFAQRRNQQNAVDLAALAGANAYLNTPGTIATRTAAAQAAALASASSNGYTDGVNGVEVDTPAVTLLQSGAAIGISITATHVNSFARVLGATEWDVSVDATAVGGTVDTGIGAGPWTMSIEAFNANGTPKYDVNNPTYFGESNGDYPVSETDLSWTDYNGANNVSTSEVEGIVRGSNVITATFQFGEYLGQHNQGNHAALYQVVDLEMRDEIVPIPIVGPAVAPATTCSNPTSYTDGCFKGWALFHVISADLGSKRIYGYFEESFVASPLNVGECPPNPTSPCGLPDDESPFNRLIVRLTD